MDNLWYCLKGNPVEWRKVANIERCAACKCLWCSGFGKCCSEAKP